MNPDEKKSELSGGNQQRTSKIRSGRKYVGFWSYYLSSEDEKEEENSVNAIENQRHTTSPKSSIVCAGNNQRRDSDDANTSKTFQTMCVADEIPWTNLAEGNSEIQENKNIEQSSARSLSVLPHPGFSERSHSVHMTTLHSQKTPSDIRRKVTYDVKPTSGKSKYGQVCGRYTAHQTPFIRTPVTPVGTLSKVATGGTRKPVLSAGIHVCSRYAKHHTAYARTPDTPNNALRKVAVDEKRTPVESTGTKSCSRYAAHQANCMRTSITPVNALCKLDVEAKQERLTSKVMEVHLHQVACKRTVGTQEQQMIAKRSCALEEIAKYNLPVVRYESVDESENVNSTHSAMGTANLTYSIPVDTGDSLNIEREDTALGTLTVNDRRPLVPLTLFAHKHLQSGGTPIPKRTERNDRSGFLCFAQASEEAVHDRNSCVTMFCSHEESEFLPKDVPVATGETSEHKLSVQETSSRKQLADINQIINIDVISSEKPSLVEKFNPGKRLERTEIETFHWIGGVAALDTKTCGTSPIALDEKITQTENAKKVLRKPRVIRRKKYVLRSWIGEDFSEVIDENGNARIVLRDANTGNDGRAASTSDNVAAVGQNGGAEQRQPRRTRKRL